MDFSQIDPADIEAVSELLGVYADPFEAVEDECADPGEDATAAVLTDHVVMRRAFQLLLAGGLVSSEQLAKAVELARSLA